MAELRKVLGLRLRQARKVRGWTQAALADNADLSLDMIGRLERGQVAPSLDTVERLAVALSISPASLLGGELAAVSDGAKGQVLARLNGMLSTLSAKDLEWVESLIKVAMRR